jgi:Helicase conserved C-terminal domain/SNF2-related domain
MTPCTVLPDERALVIESDDPRLLTTIPSAERLAPGFVCMPHDIDTAIRLTMLGIDAPHPIETYYSWPRDRVQIPAPFAHQHETAAFMVRNPHAYVLNDIGCVDASTEYLSPTGWRKMDAYDGGLVGQYNLDGTVELVAPAAYVKKPCAEMIRFKTKYGIDQLLSPDHTVLYVASAGGRMTVPAAHVERTYVESAMGWPGRFITTFSLKTTTRMGLTDAQLRVMVAVIADGHFPNSTDRCVVRLKKQRKKDRLRVLLCEADIAWQERQITEGIAAGFSIFSFAAPIHTKEFGKEFWACSAAQLGIVANEFVHWDGGVRKSGAAQFFSASKASADFIQYACATTGRTATLFVTQREDAKTEYTVHARSGAALLYLKGMGKEGKSNNVWREPSPDGFMYCFNVPSGFLILRRNGCIFATGNTGKSLSAAWAADYLIEQGYGHRALIIAPLSTLERVWGDTFFVHFTHRTFAVLHGSADKRRKLLAQPRDFYIVNHDGITILEKDLAKRPDIDIVIIDELAVYRNRNTGKWKAIDAVLYPERGEPRPWVWGLTGTPTPNAPTDAYGQCRLVTPTTVPKFFGQFRAMVMDHQSTYVWTPRREATKIVYDVMRPAIRFKRDDCIDLPPTIYQTRDVELSAEQTRHLKELMRELVTEVEGKRITAANEGIKLNKALQLAGGCAYDTDGTPHEIDTGNRLETLMEVIEEAGGKILVFVPFTAMTTMIARALSKHWETAIITGDTPVKERNDIFLRFQDTSSDLEIIVAHPGTMSHGLTLVEASVVVWWTGIDSNDTYTQACGRITRPGQHRTTCVINLSGSAVERRVYKRLQDRQKLQGSLLEMVERGESIL